MGYSNAVAANPAAAFLFTGLTMSVHISPLRAAVLGAALSVSALFAAPAHAFADDEARRAILDLREQVKQLTDQSRQVRLRQADQIEMLQ